MNHDFEAVLGGAVAGVGVGGDAAVSESLYAVRALKRAKEAKQLPLVDGDIYEVGEANFWLTPPNLMKSLQQEFNFTFDAAPYPRPAGFDALKTEWGLRTYCNPPIGKGHSISAWVNKAIEQRKEGKTVVMFLPFPRWFKKLLDVDVEFRYPGITHFLNPNGRASKQAGGGFVPDILVIMKPKESQP